MLALRTSSHRSEYFAGTPPGVENIHEDTEIFVLKMNQQKSDKSFLFLALTIMQLNTKRKNV